MSKENEPEIKAIRIGDDQIEAIDYKAPGRETGMIVVGLTAGVEEVVFPELEESPNPDN